MGEGKSYFGDCLLFPLTRDSLSMVISGQHVQMLRDTPVCWWDQVPQPFEQTESPEPSHQPVPIALARAAL